MFNFVIEISGAHIFFQSIYINIKMDKIISIKHETINRQVANLQKKVKVSFIVGKPISSVPLKYLVIESNIYNIGLIFSIMTLMM